jgi:predicted amidohydrolase
MLEIDPRWPNAVFNTTCLIGPEGILYKYRKVNTWIPYEVHASPHDIDGYDEPLFPVADTPIGRIGCAICYDWLFLKFYVSSQQIEPRS